MTELERDEEYVTGREVVGPGAIDEVAIATAPDFEPAVEAQAGATPPSARVLSIDALRGFDMFWIVGGDDLARSLCAWWGTPQAKELNEQFEHVDWAGFRFYDLIFPLFLFLVGAVLPYSLAKYQGTDGSKRGPLLRIARRVLVLYLLGLVYSGLLNFNFPMRMTGVLPRIAFCYGAAAVIFLFTTVRARAILFAAILLGYWALLALVPAPETGKRGDYAKETNLAGWVDRHYLPGKIFDGYYKYGDNEGLLSMIPAVATALLGVMAGTWLRTDRNPWLKVVALIAAGAASVALGYAWGEVFPIIKNLWTSSFVLVAGGFSLMLLGLFYAIIDVVKLRGWAFFFVVIGMNAITIYLASSFIPFDRIAGKLLGGTARIANGYSPGLRDVILAVGVLALEWLLLLDLYRRRIFLRV
ncbi:hypothetical protein OJF2_36140 [Aquisphaera giovannonii]|uniref:DUF5009 domain-containing protein n=1 Tax=Aquisphaera giovannonii TaxID=406548 RepID=A0A5B9W4E1_9BACT|nr:DUF5009 domain-containing protein [Aquisphaera giovannonii]QEH35069.1 hypothetical protein OJF2_36140 [Aquisphaera giovannonii]